MSETVIFGVGIFVFAFTVWGTVMAGGFWFGHLAEVEDERSRPTPVVTDPKVEGLGDTPERLSGD